METTARLELMLDSRLDEIARLTEALEAFCDAHALPERTAFLFTLCFDELLTNIVTHGFAGAAGHPVIVRLALDAGWLRAEIVDDGPPFDPLQIPSPNLASPLEDRPIGGLGAHFVTTLMDEVGYCRRDDGNHLRFAQQLSPTRPTPENE